MELKEFQLSAVKALFEAMDKPVRDIILKSPTGSGKTIILTYCMHPYIQSYPKTVCVWLTPGKGTLEDQDLRKTTVALLTGRNSRKKATTPSKTANGQTFWSTSSTH